MPLARKLRKKKNFIGFLLFCAFQPDHYDINVQEDLQEVSFAAFRYLLYEIPSRTRICSSGGGMFYAGSLRI